MGRKKINIRPIQNDSNRRATFEKRRIGLLKKAMELSILCDSVVSVSIERKIEGDLQVYSSDPYDEVLDRFQRFDGTYRLLTNDHLPEMVPGKMSSNHIGYKVRKRPSASAVAFSPYFNTPTAVITPQSNNHSNRHSHQFFTDASQTIHGNNHCLSTTNSASKQQQKSFNFSFSPSNQHANMAASSGNNMNPYVGGIPPPPQPFMMDLPPKIEPIFEPFSNNFQGEKINQFRVDSSKNKRAASRRRSFNDMSLEDDGFVLEFEEESGQVSSNIGDGLLQPAHKKTKTLTETVSNSTDVELNQRMTPPSLPAEELLLAVPEAEEASLL